VHRLPMLIRPSRVASARRTPAPDAAAPQACKLRKRKISEEEEHVAVVTTEFNYQYRVGDGSFIVCKEKEDGGTYETPVLFVSMVSPKGAPDITEIGALYLYNTDYLTRNLQDYNNLLPAEVVGKNCWVLANRPVNFSSARPSSAWMATPARACNGEMRALAMAGDGTILHATDDTLGEDPNGYKEEHLIVVGGVVLANRAGSKVWKDQVIKYHPLRLVKDGVKDLVGALGYELPPEETRGRCPWDRSDTVERIARQLVILPHARAAAVAEYNVEDGIFETRMYDNGTGKPRLVRLLGATDRGEATVIECPRIMDLGKRFPGNTFIREMLATPRRDRVWGRAPGEVVVACETALGSLVVPLAALAPEPDLVVTPPFVAPVINLIDTGRVHVHELALTAADGRLEKLPLTPLSTVLASVRLLALEKGMVTKLAQASIRWSTIAHALSLGYDSHAQMINVKMPYFGARKVFSLDVGPHLSVADPANNLIGYTFRRHEEDEQEAEDLIDTLDCKGIAIVRPPKSNGTGGFTKYLTFAEHPKHENEFLWNMATDMCELRVAVRWWDTALEQFGGVPLDMANHEDQAFAIIDNKWHAVHNEPVVNEAMKAARFPTYMDKHYR